MFEIHYTAHSPDNEHEAATVIEAGDADEARAKFLIEYGVNVTIHTVLAL